MAALQPVPVALCLSALEPGGTERQTLELARRLDRGRFRVHVVCARPGGTWRPEMEAAADSITVFPLRGFRQPSTLAQVAAFASWCRRRGIAIVHACDFYSDVFNVVGAALARVPVRIASRRGFNVDRTPGQRRLLRATYPLAHRIVANSEAMAAQVAAEGVSRDRIVVIPNGIDPAAFPAPARRSGRPRLITVANLRPGKGHRVLLEAIAPLVPRWPGLELLCVGDGPERSALESRARTLNIESHVRFLGHRDDVGELLASSDLFVLASRSEAFPNAVMEAMAAGLPVVATRTGGIPELVTANVTGVLVPVDDAGAIEKAIKSLLSQPERAAALGAAARQHVLSRYSFDRMVERFTDLYLSELGRRHALARQSRLATSQGPSA